MIMLYDNRLQSKRV